jgi:Uma2 family endonuclease
MVETLTAMAEPLAAESTDVDLVTAEEMMAMDDIGPCELIDGHIIRTPPAGYWHGVCAARLSSALSLYVAERGRGSVSTGEIGLVIRRGPDRVRGADVLYISDERLAQVTNPRRYLEVAPELIVEVMSPDNAWSDMVAKLRDYFSIGVQVVWLADPESRTVLAYRSLTDVKEFGPDDCLVEEAVLPGFRVAVAEVFAV